MRAYVSMSPESAVRLSILRRAPLNSWVALSPDESRIVAVGQTYAEVAKLSDAAGEADPIILKTPTQWGPVSFTER